jgi:hypothetical protein
MLMRRIDEWKETAVKINAMPEGQRRHLGRHLAGEYSDRLPKRIMDRVDALEAGYEIDHTLIAGLAAAGVDLGTF